MFRNPHPHVLYLYFSSAITFVLDCSTLDCTHRSTDRTAFAEKKSGNPRQEVCWVRWNFLLLGSKNVAFRVAQPVSDRRALLFCEICVGAGRRRKRVFRWRRRWKKELQEERILPANLSLSLVDFYLLPPFSPSAFSYAGEVVW